MKIKLCHIVTCGIILMSIGTTQTVSAQEISASQSCNSDCEWKFRLCLDIGEDPDTCIETRKRCRVKCAKIDPSALLTPAEQCQRTCTNNFKSCVANLLNNDKDEIDACKKDRDECRKKCLK